MYKCTILENLGVVFVLNRTNFQNCTKAWYVKICSYLPYFVVIITCDDGKCV